MVPATPLRYLLTLSLLGAGALLLWIMRPRFDTSLVDGADAGASCLNNLRQISRAYALYARDFDGKIPRGVDPEDRFNPEIWRQTNSPFGGAFFDDATRTPFLHEILRPYVKSPEVFHCPADQGWTQSRLPTLSNSGLRNVKPSSFAKYGTSYFCFTKYGFALQTSADLPDPANVLLVFDGDLWHSNAGRQLINGMFADGHVENLTTAQFEFYSRG